MLGRTHLIIGLFVSLVSLILFDISNPLLFVLLVLFGSLFPDIDTPTSKFGKKSKAVSLFFSHRGFFHSVYTMIIISFIINFFLGWFFALGFAIGFFIHLILDSFTKKGIAFFVFDKRINGGFKSGGVFDLFLFWFFLASNLYLLIIILL